MSKYTPGPWLEKNRKLIAQDGKSVGSATFGTRPHSECNANSCLISAAPDLLDALQAFVDHGTCFSDDDMGAARAAIAKATNVKSRA